MPLNMSYRVDVTWGASNKPPVTRTKLDTLAEVDAFIKALVLAAHHQSALYTYRVMMYNLYDNPPRWRPYGSGTDAPARPGGAGSIKR